MMFTRIAAAVRPRTARACSTLGEPGKVAVNGINLHYLRSGSKGPPVVCLPGAMGAPRRRKCGSQAVAGGKRWYPATAGCS